MGPPGQGRARPDGRDQRADRPDADPADLAGGHRRRFPRCAGPPRRQLPPVHPHRRWRHIAPEELLPASAAAAQEGDNWQQAVEESELLAETGAQHDQELFLDGVTTPVLFASAVSNFGVGALLDALVDLAPPPPARPDVDGALHEVDEPFSAFVFKVQSGMDAAHRDRLAYIRICTGVFERGMVVTHAAPAAPSRRSTPSTCSAANGRASTWRTPATSSAW